MVRRMNKYRREALAAFANPSEARHKVDMADVFKKIGDVLNESAAKANGN